MDIQLDTEQLEAWRLFITANATLIEIIDREMLAAEQIPLHWYDVLIELHDAPQQRLRMHELARRVVLSRSTLTRLVDRLETAGLLVRERSTTDRRGAYAVLTPQGLDALRQAWPVYRRGIAEHFGRYLGAEEGNVLRTVCTRILDAVVGAQSTQREPSHEHDAMHRTEHVQGRDLPA